MASIPPSSASKRINSNRSEGSGAGASKGGVALLETMCITSILEGSTSPGQSLYQARRQLGAMDDSVEKVLLSAHYELVDLAKDQPQSRMNLLIDMWLPNTGVFQCFCRCVSPCIFVNHQPSSQDERKSSLWTCRFECGASIDLRFE